MRYYIGMDIGGTCARLKVANAEGGTICAAEGRGGTISSLGPEKM